MVQANQVDLGKLEEKKRRLDALLSDLKKDKAKIGDIPRAATISCLYDRLWDFGRAQFAFFYDAFRPDHKAIDLEFSGEEAAKLDMLDQILKRIEYDRDLLQKAIDGRHDSQTRELLEEADDFAFSWLKLVKSEYLNSNPTVLTYFAEKQTITRIVPYANVMIIGLDKCKTRPIEISVAAHEIAHYIYWDDRSDSQHGRIGYRRSLNGALEGFVKEARLDEQLIDEQLKKVIDAWSEEIFADAVGCMLGTAWTAFHLQDMLKTEPDFWQGGTDYPPAAIRPFIYHEVLGELFGRNHEFVTKLQEEWQEYLTKKDAKRPVAQRGTVTIEKRAYPIPTMQQLLEAVTETIQKKVFIPEMKISYSVPFDDRVQSLDKFAEQDARARNEVIKRRFTPLESLDPECETSEPVHIWREKVKVLGYLSPEQLAQIPSASDLLNEATQVRQPLLQLKTEEWKPIFEFVGWTTEGPNNGPK